jgi:hypothetical protein
VSDRPGTWRDKWDDRHYMDPLDHTQTWTGVSAILNAKYKPYLEKARLKAQAEHAARHRKRFATYTRATDVVAELLDQSVTLPEWERKRDAGTQAHEVIDRLAKGQTVNPALRASDHPVNWAQRHWADFLEDTGFQVANTELTVISDRYGYGGSLDILGHLPDGTTCLVDAKTNQGGPRSDVGLQLEFYDRADFILDCENGDRIPWTRTDKHYVLWMRPDGWAWVPVLSGDEVWRECYSRLLTYQDNLADRMIGEPEAGTLELPGGGWWG